VLIASQTAAQVFVNTWLTAGAANVVITLYFMTDFLRLFARGLSACMKLEKFNGIDMIMVSLISIPMAINFSTVFFYALEKGYRKLYFLEKEMKKVYNSGLISFLGSTKVEGHP